MRRPAANAHRVQQAAQRDVAQVAKVIAVQEAQIAALQTENERLIARFFSAIDDALNK